MFITFRKRTTLPVCAYDEALRRWRAGASEKIEAGDEMEVGLLRENEETLDIEIPGGGIVFDLAKADVEILPLDVVEGSHILKGILAWPWEAEPATDMDSGQVGCEVLQSQNLHDGTHLDAGEWAILLDTEARLTEAEARLIAKAPEMYSLLRQLLAGQPVMTQVGQLINELELSMEEGKEPKSNGQTTERRRETQEIHGASAEAGPRGRRLRAGHISGAGDGAVSQCGCCSGPEGSDRDGRSRSEPEGLPPADHHRRLARRHHA